MKSIKFDKEKIMVDLMDPEFIEEMSKVLTMGANKYAPENWKGLDPKRLLAALYRHLLASHKGEIIDKESGLSHMAHVAVNAMFLFWFENHKFTMHWSYIQPQDAPYSGCSGE